MNIVSRDNDPKEETHVNSMSLECSDFNQLMILCVGLNFICTITHSKNR